MTRKFNDWWQCPNCGVKHGKETLFRQWMREHPLLDSRDGIACFDSDHWVHRFKFVHDRRIQCLMLIELKTHGADMTDSQRDTLGMVDQLLRNRGANAAMKHQRRRRQAGGIGVNLTSQMTGRKITCRLYGVHLLQFEKDGPQNSAWMKWDNSDINEEQLVSLLRFDIDPDTLRPIDLRRHHKRQRVMFGTEDQSNG